MKPESLLKVLTGASIGSRRRMADTIKQERVAVNGQVVTDFRHPVNIGDRITLDGKPVNLKPEETVTLLLNKPPDIMSTTRDERGRQTVIDLIPAKYRHLSLHPVGRLDRESTGLLLLTNDGALTYRLTHPRFEHEKEYLVHVADRLKSGEKRKLEKGIRLEDGMTSPATLKEIDSPPFSYSLTIHEGRKRQVRRMFASLGHEVLALKRIRMGNLSLGNLAEGKTRQLSTQEVSRLLSQT